MPPRPPREARVRPDAARPQVLQRAGVAIDCANSARRARTRRRGTAAGCKASRSRVAAAPAARVASPPTARRRAARPAATGCGAGHGCAALDRLDGARRIVLLERHLGRRHQLGVGAGAIGLGQRQPAVARSVSRMRCAARAAISAAGRPGARRRAQPARAVPRVRIFLEQCQQAVAQRHARGLGLTARLVVAHPRRQVEALPSASSSRCSNRNSTMITRTAKFTETSTRYVGHRTATLRD